MTSPFRIMVALFLTTLFTSCINSKKYNEALFRPKAKYYNIKLDIDEDKIVIDVINPENFTSGSIKISLDKKRLTVKDASGANSKRTIEIKKGEVSDDTYNKLSAIVGSYKGVSNFYPSPLQDFVPSIDEKAYFDAKEVPFRMTKKTFPRESVTRSEKFTYIESQPIFQAMTVPFKFRGQLNDTIPAQATTSFNVGLAYGRKFALRSFDVRYKNDKTVGVGNPSFSITPGVFVGPTLVKLENGNSVSERIDLDRTVGGITYGGFLVFGVDNFNFGLAAGYDKAMGSDRDKWIYQDDSFWWGFVLSFGFIK